ncbi:TraB/GumN family protein [Leptospira wolffii]|uniref:TraB/GumN family protein n=1 Tax=Leptospira wolffii TaxID=409998 RepID=UPI0010824371|nr:TraB/GumN family protein [Leptospira wolffii]TGK59381.1 TraB/GumN family protein [Leptospira wolffii]TGK71236.1 TraB/GumN family protein [Leptospira wolffii]TGK77803.1 TraB/GumN family protein [Leptospira wolffii]TGL29486.1 TraB/GumN family protein [Leptospira wolffii]
MQTVASSEPVRNLEIGGSQVTILGTAHISQKSIEAVSRIIEEDKPDVVCVELCASRMRSVKEPDHWKKLDIFKVFRERKMWLLLSSLILSSFQKKLGNGNIRPGDEMRKAIEEGEKIGAKIVPVDREISITLKRAWWNVGLWNRMFLFSALVSSLLAKEDVSPEKIEEMKSDDVLKDLFSQLPTRYNSVKNVIIDERDKYLAQRIRESAAKGKKIFAVVGAGHLEGIMKHINEDQSIDALDVLPVKGFWDKVRPYLFPAIIISAFTILYWLGGKEEGTDFLIRWILVKGGLAALGAIIALAHPVSIILAFLAAPIGNFNPIVKPGWVAALSESWLRKPLVEDFEKIGEDTETLAGFWRNNVIRIFLVFILPQLGSSIGTFIVSKDFIQKIPQLLGALFS